MFINLKKKRNSTTLNTKLFSLLINLLSSLYFLAPKISKLLNLNKKDRYYRSILINKTLSLLQKILLSINYNVPLTIYKKKVIVDLDGVLLIPGKINRYYKLPHNKKYNNEAKYLEELLDFCDARNIIDIGACIGEYSIYFAKNFPKSKVISVEVEQSNLKLLEENIRLNKCDNSIKVIKNAVSDFAGQNFSIIGNTQESEAVVSNTYSELKTITLSSLINSEKLDKIDFLKVDIEGSNYKVSQCIINNLSKINAFQYAFEKGPPEIFLSFIDSIKYFYNFFIFEEDGFKSIALDDLIKKTKKVGPTPTLGISFEVLFIKKLK